MDSIAVGIVCKTPAPGLSKTRLFPPLSPEECAALATCFIRDTAGTVSGLIGEGVTAYAIYTPVGTGHALRELLPAGFRMLPQDDGDLGARRGGAVVLSPALDGGYMLIGLSALHERLFADIPWSTAQVYERTLAARRRDRPAGRRPARLV